jgi:hypothetical protein
MDAFDGSDSTSPHTAQAFSQSVPNTSGFNSQKSHPTKLLSIKKFSDEVIPH